METPKEKNNKSTATKRNTTNKNETKIIRTESKKNQPIRKETKKQNIKKEVRKQERKQKDYKLSILLIILILIIIIVLLLFNKNQKGDWVQKGNVISRGNESYEIGDYYEYDESNNGNIKGLTDVKWKVLGIDENSNLLIMSASSIESLTLGDKDNLETSQQDYINGSKKVNNITKNYGKGKDAIAVRSFTDSDIVKLSNYNEENKYEEYIYYWTSEEKPISIKVSDNSEVISKHPYTNSFIWYDTNTKQWQNTLKTGTETNENPVKITTAKDSRFNFDNNIYYTENYRIPLGSKIYNMVYLNDAGEREMYWTDNQFINATSGYIAYGQNVVIYNGLNSRVFVYSTGDAREETAGVRAVVTID